MRDRKGTQLAESSLNALELQREDYQLDEIDQEGPRQPGSDHARDTHRFIHFVLNDEEWILHG